MGLRENFQLLRIAHSERGLREVLRTISCGLRYRGTTRKILVALTKPRILPEATEAARTHTFRFATLEELRTLQQDPAARIAELDIDRCRRGTARCMLQLDGAQLVGYSWVWNTRPAQIDNGIYIHLPTDTRYVFKGLTASAYRGQAFQALRHLRTLEALRDEGVRCLFGFVDQYNFKSLHGVRKSGFEPVGRVMLHRRNGRVRMTVDVDENFWSEDAGR
jgi:RimJ/RimL family protein N-acetyltransferase